jgi:hypothetical protein
MSSGATAGFQAPFIPRTQHAITREVLMLDRDVEPERHGRHRYGLTTQDAITAYRDGHPELLPAANRWKFLVDDHAAGRHVPSDPRLLRICPICRMTAHRGVA